MSETLNEFDEAADKDHPQYTLLNEIGQAFGFAIAYGINNRHLFKQENGVQEFSDDLYETFTEHLHKSLSPNSIAVLHGIVEGMENAIPADES